MPREPLPPPNRRALDGLGVMGPCPRPDAPLDRILYDHLEGQGAALSCGNAFTSLVHFPDAGPLNPSQASGPLGAYEVLADSIRGARREVLLENMIWDDDQPGRTTPAPGALIAQAIAELRQDVRDHPERHPQGVTVRLLLGNSVRVDSLLNPESSVYSAARHLLLAGVPLAGDTVPGWTLELANYTYFAPHDHAKLLIVDGEDVSAGGYNISWFHVPLRTRGGRDLTDLALRVRGPVARHAVAAFRDAWLHSRQLHCPGSVTPATLKRCALVSDVASFPLVWTSPPVPAGSSRVYGLYRRSGYMGADDAVSALFGAAQTRIDLMQSQVSGTLRCSLSLLAPGGCPFPAEHLPVWHAIVGAVRERGVQVRLVVDYDPVLQLETLAFLAGAQAALKPLGLQHHVQARWSGTDGGLHSKAALIDGQMLTVGSQNLHFSSFGDRGLNEYTLATSDPAALAAAQRTFDFEWGRSRPLTLPSWLRP
ncbi:phospholipase D-like domain-containing protein [Deinococcus malanensis]|uniref:phospholipase D-like domain-containing protein n=1 Tax=Deinococcus malanensis TaxID=1706855 RepID=UPI001E617A8B|nr:phospholipase D-like domain-containing protein [Deinococcus malanensis]